VSFADGTQCGDGTIYRASGFHLIGIKKNTELVINPKTGETMATMAAYHKGFASQIATWEKLSGFMLRYIYFLDPTARARLTVPILPFSEIDKRGAGMYRGKQRIQSRAVSDTKDTADFQSAKGGSTPTTALQSSE
jgi:hypothetical protein